MDASADKLDASIYVIMGVSGVGKTTIAKAISQSQKSVFLEGDDFHPKENVEKMSSGQPLTDQDRMPWLKALSVAAGLKKKEGNVVMTCSALKRDYREEIGKYIPGAMFVHLEGSFDYIAEQMSRRQGHFMPTSLLRSQFDTLEPLGGDELGTTISIENGIETVLSELETFMNKKTA